MNDIENKLREAAATCRPPRPATPGSPSAP